MVYKTLEFNIKGVTFNNEDGKDIQKEIRKIFLEYEKNGEFEKYSGYTNAEIKELCDEIAEFEDAKVEMSLEEDTYENKPCVKAYLKKYDGNYCHVGYIPKGMVKEYLKLKNDFKEMKITANLVGGKIKQVEYDYDIAKEKEIQKIETIDLTYGFEVSLMFYNDKEELQKEIEKRKQKAIDEYKSLELEQRQKIEEEQKKILNLKYQKDWQKEQEEKEQEQERIQNEEKIKKRKIGARIGLILYPILFLESFFIMPFGIILLIISFLGFIACLGMAF